MLNNLNGQQVAKVIEDAFDNLHEVEDKQFKTKPKAEAWARKNLEMEV